ncbi:unnamed protein product, partial [Musa acuminata var. zebrina]
SRGSEVFGEEEKTMGTREVYEEKLRRGNLHHDPTINPGLGSARCPRCLSLINRNSEKEEWTINSVLHDATFVAGSGAGVMLSAVHGMNIGIPFVQKHVKGPKWLHFLFVIPPLLLYSGASASLGAKYCFFFNFLFLVQVILTKFSIYPAYVVPRFAQLTVTSYYAASSASHYAVSRATRYIEESHSSQSSRDV